MNGAELSVDARIIGRRCWKIVGFGLDRIDDGIDCVDLRLVGVDVGLAGWVVWQVVGLGVNSVDDGINIVDILSAHLEYDHRIGCASSSKLYEYIIVIQLGCGQAYLIEPGRSDLGGSICYRHRRPCARTVFGVCRIDGG